MNVLCVAEKPSISKSITNILSGGQFHTRHSRSPIIKNYDFDYPQTRAHFTVTCVAGHILQHDFASSHRKWHSCDPFDLFDAPIAHQLMIWTDCDREGENIGAEIVKICRKSKPNIVVKRARFSAIIAQQIHRAAQHPVELDFSQAAAVDARIVLDLRIGAAFTRMQTLRLQPLFQQIQSVVSYGPCQFPTLGFVVSRFDQVQAFKPEKFWYIYLALNYDASDGEEETPFTWARNHLLNSTRRSPYTQVKPLPLTTVELQKAGSRLLRLSPKKVLDHAEHLYQQGFLSYPRTETDQYDPQFDFASLIAKQTVDPTWGQFATRLQDNGGYAPPRRGKNNDKAHPPIHPTAHAGNLAGDEKRVYEFITRRFLASCSKDALGFETTVDVVYGAEDFYAKGLIVLERNYLEVYPYDKWSGKELPDFQEGSTFVPSICELREGATTKPSLLTEADLVGIMDKNGIGTDATIAQHIETIINREYVIPRMEGSTKYLVPSTFGIALVQGYNEIGFDRSLSKPQLRRETERNVVAVCEGTKTKNDMIVEAVDQYKDMYLKARTNFEKVISSKSVRRYIERNGRPNGGGNNDDGEDPPGAPRGGRGRGNGRGGAPPPPDDSDGGSDGEPPPARGRGRGRGRGATRGARNAAPSRVPSRPPSVAARPARPPVAARGSDSEDALWDAVATPPPSPPRHAPGPPVPSFLAGPSRAPPPAPRATPTAGPNTAPPQTNCFCGKPAVDRTVKKEGANKGRPFRRCGQPAECDFFEWCDEPPPEARPAQSRPGQPSIPAKRPYAEHAAPKRYCQCELTAVLKTVSKEGANKGRQFWSCPSQAARCNFFEWDDGENGPGAGAGAASGHGPGPAPLSARTQSAGGQPTAGECFNCGQPGHWASACPSGNQRGNLKRSKTTAGKTQGGAGGGECFKCGKEGHYSKGECAS
ncbi:DNA topoisomerase [Gloeopeniophorella convolvens]|nr:DNA topoisomerase [Gloeopeniophorella convolvens]